MGLNRDLWQKIDFASSSSNQTLGDVKSDRVTDFKFWIYFWVMKAYCNLKASQRIESSISLQHFSACFTKD